MSYNILNGLFFGCILTLNHCYKFSLYRLDFMVMNKTKALFIFIYIFEPQAYMCFVTIFFTHMIATKCANCIFLLRYQFYLCSAKLFTILQTTHKSWVVSVKLFPSGTATYKITNIELLVTCYLAICQY